jgi:hypothetical protein
VTFGPWPVRASATRLGVNGIGGTPGDKGDIMLISVLLVLVAFGIAMGIVWLSAAGERIDEIVGEFQADDWLLPRAK